MKQRDYEGDGESYGDDGYVHYLDGFMGMYCVEIHQIVYFNYVQLTICQLIYTIKIQKDSKNLTLSSAFPPYPCSSLCFLPFPDHMPVLRCLCCKKCYLSVFSQFLLYQLRVTKHRERNIIIISQHLGAGFKIFTYYFLNVISVHCSTL